MVTHGVGGVGGVGSDGGLLRRAADWRLAEGRERETVATGFPSLDRLLPAGGVRRGSLTEWLAVGAAARAEAQLAAVVDGELQLEVVAHVDVQVLANLPELQDRHPLGLPPPFEGLQVGDERVLVHRRRR